MRTQERANIIFAAVVAVPWKITRSMALSACVVMLPELSPRLRRSGLLAYTPVSPKRSLIRERSSVLTVDALSRTLERSLRSGCRATTSPKTPSEISFGPLSVKKPSNP